MKITKLSRLAFAGCFILLSTHAMAEDTNQAQPAPGPAIKRKAGAKHETEDKKAEAFFKKQLESDRLPGLSSTAVVDDSTTKFDAAKNSATFEVRANGFQYDYEFTKASSKRNPWKLKKAWRTDKDKNVKEFPIYQSTEE